MKISAIILAAGLSTRMGKPKVLMPIQNKPMFLNSVELAIEAKLNPIYVIGGEYMDEINSFLQGYPVESLCNNNYKIGMSTSLKLGMQTVQSHCDATIVFLADQPLTPKLVVDRIIKEYTGNHTKIVRPKYNGIPGHPILFDSSLFQEFDSVQGDVGGKSILQAYKSEMKWIPFAEEIWGRDIDTQEEYQSLLEYIETTSPTKP